ncbi:MAG: GerAB/ArcD/ProY family transporter [Clostridia bacterium]|nr:GerAB/ArcD/ProY family transporter [Clostridia bacterium]
MKKLVTVRQLILILIVSMLTLKVLYLPSLIAKDIGKDAYLFVFSFLMFDFIVLLLLLYLFNKNPNLSFYEILKNIFGTVLSKIIMFIFFAFFFAKCWAVFQSNYNYLNENLYSSLNWLVFSVPILFVVLYMSKFGVNSAARLAEIFVPIVIAGFLFSLFVGTTKADFTELLPFLEKGFFTQFPKFFKYSFWFGDYIIFIVFFGNVKQEKKQNLKITLSILITIFLTTFFISVVFATFKNNAVCHSNAISDMVQVLATGSDIGNFDWVLILIWDIALFLFFMFNSLGAFYCFRQTFFKRWQLLSISIILLGVFLLNVFNNFDIHNGIIFMQGIASYFIIFAQYILPVLIVFFWFVLKRRKNAKVYLEK